MSVRENLRKFSIFAGFLHILRKNGRKKQKNDVKGM